MGKKGRTRQEANGEHEPKIGRVGKKHGAAATGAAKRKAKRAANKDRSLPAPAQAVAALTAAPEGATRCPAPAAAPPGLPAAPATRRQGHTPPYPGARRHCGTGSRGGIDAHASGAGPVGARGPGDRGPDPAGRHRVRDLAASRALPRHRLPVLDPRPRHPAPVPPPLDAAGHPRRGRRRGLPRASGHGVLSHRQRRAGRRPLDRTRRPRRVRLHGPVAHAVGRAGVDRCPHGRHGHRPAVGGRPSEGHRSRRRAEHRRRRLVLRGADGPAGCGRRAAVPAASGGLPRWWRRAHDRRPARQDDRHHRHGRDHRRTGALVRIGRLADAPGHPARRPGHSGPHHRDPPRPAPMAGSAHGRRNRHHRRDRVQPAEPRCRGRRTGSEGPAAAVVPLHPPGRLAGAAARRYRRGDRRLRRQHPHRPRVPSADRP